MALRKEVRAVDLSPFAQAAHTSFKQSLAACTCRTTSAAPAKLPSRLAFMIDPNPVCLIYWNAGLPDALLEHRISCRDVFTIAALG
jgi:hypothetical protein